MYASPGFPEYGKDTEHDLKSACLQIVRSVLNLFCEQKDVCNAHSGYIVYNNVHIVDIVYNAYVYNVCIVDINIMLNLFTVCTSNTMYTLDTMYTMYTQCITDTLYTFCTLFTIYTMHKVNRGLAKHDRKLFVSVSSSLFTYIYMCTQY